MEIRRGLAGQSETARQQPTLIAVERPGEQRLDFSERQLVRIQHGAEDLIVGGEIAAHRSVAERAQQNTSTVPIRTKTVLLMFLL